EIAAGSRTPFEKHALGFGKLKDRSHRVFNRVDEARRALMRWLNSAVEPYRRTESHHLVQQKMNEFVMKDCSILLGGEVTTLVPPLHDRRRDAAYQLADAGFAFRSTSFAVEIFRGDDVGCRHRPAFRDLDVLLFENDFTRFTGDGGRPVFPFDCVVRRNALPGKIAAEFEPLARRRQVSISIGFSVENFLFHAQIPPYIVLLLADCARYKGGRTS